MFVLASTGGFRFAFEPREQNERRLVRVFASTYTKDRFFLSHVSYKSLTLMRLLAAKEMV